MFFIVIFVGNIKCVKVINVYTVKDMKASKGLYIRLTEDELNATRLYAEVYANGNVSAWVKYCLKDPPRKFLNNKRRKKMRERHRSTPSKKP